MTSHKPRPRRTALASTLDPTGFIAPRSTACHYNASAGTPDLAPTWRKETVHEPRTRSTAPTRPIVVTTISSMDCGRCYSRADEGMEAAVTTDSKATEMALASCGARTRNTNTITLGNFARDECDPQRPCGTP